MTWSAIVGYGLVASGIPLPCGTVSAGSAVAGKRLSAKDCSRPFPCMNKPCGCATAEQCFTNCCCHTAAETLAWAKAHQVDPAVIAALQRRVAAPPAPAASCCSVPKSCCAAAAAGEEAPADSLAGPEICSDYQSLATTPAVPSRVADEPDADSVSVRVVSLRAMLACGGLVAEWLACGASLPPSPVVFVVSCECFELVAGTSDRMSSLRLAPDVPPPRVA